MSQPNVVYGRTVTLVQETVLGVDQHGNDVYGPQATEIADAVVWADTTTENVDGRDQVTQSVHVLLPPGTAVSAQAQILIDGEEYEVVGRAFDWSQHPFTNSRAGLQMIVRQVTG